MGFSWSVTWLISDGFRLVGMVYSVSGRKVVWVVCVVWIEWGIGVFWVVSVFFVVCVVWETRIVWVVFSYSIILLFSDGFKVFWVVF